MKSFKIEQRSLIGISIILVGGILLLSSLGILDGEFSIGTFWPMILIVMGIVNIVNYDKATLTGFIFLILGLYFQLRNLNVTFLQDTSLGSLMWPGIIIVFGISLILPDRIKSDKYDRDDNRYYRDETIDVEYKEED